MMLALLVGLAACKANAAPQLPLGPSRFTRQRLTYSISDSIENVPRQHPEEDVVPLRLVAQPIRYVSERNSRRRDSGIAPDIPSGIKSTLCQQNVVLSLGVIVCMVVCMVGHTHAMCGPRQSPHELGEIRRPQGHQYLENTSYYSKRAWDLMLSQRQTCECVQHLCHSAHAGSLSC
jgi:hypothetical protein